MSLSRLMADLAKLGIAPEGSPSSLYIASDTYANIVANYNATTYDGYKAMSSDRGELLARAGVWVRAVSANDAARYSHYPVASGYFPNRFNWSPGARASIAVIGDSISLGAYGSVTAAQWPYVGYIGLLRTALIAAGYIDGGEGYISPLRTDAWVKTGTFATIANEAMSGTCYYATGASNYWTLTTPSNCDNFDVWYIDGDGAGDFEITVDGGAPITVVPPKLANNARKAYNVTLGSVGSHTIVVKAPASGYIYFLGGAIYKGTTGLVIHNFSNNGGGTYDFYDAANKKLLVFGLISPKLVLLNLIANDFSGQTATSSYTTRLNQIITGSAAYSAAIVGLSPPDNGLTRTIPVATYEGLFKDALIAAGQLYVDIHTLWGSYASNSAYMYDTQHPNASGHARLKTTVLAICQSLGA